MAIWPPFSGWTKAALRRMRELEDRDGMFCRQLYGEQTRFLKQVGRKRWKYSVSKRFR